MLSRLILGSGLALILAAGPSFVSSQTVDTQIPLNTHADDFSSAYAYVPQRMDDDRSPCPALNALANHGYLPHDGRHIYHSDLYNALREGYGLTVPLASLLTFGSYALLRQVPPLSLTDIGRVHGVEHNCSLVHDDIPDGFEYPESKVDACLLQQLFADSKDTRTFDIEDIARARVRRESSPEYRSLNVTIDALHAEIARGEMALVLDILGNGEEVDLDVLRDFFVDERLPDDWKPTHPQGLVKTALTARKIKNQMTQLRGSH